MPIRDLTGDTSPLAWRHAFLYLTPGAKSLLFALLVPPLFILTIWLNAPGVLSGSLLACMPGLPWLGKFVLALWLAALVASVAFAILGIARDDGRSKAVGAVALLTVMAPILFVVMFFMIYGDPGAGAPMCPFWAAPNTPRATVEPLGTHVWFPCVVERLLFSPLKRARRYFRGDRLWPSSLSPI